MPHAELDTTARRELDSLLDGRGLSGLWNVKRSTATNA